MSGKLNHCNFSSLSLLFILQVFLLTNCSAPVPPPEKAIYFWRSSFQPGQKEKEFLTKNGIDTLFVRYFDIDLEQSTGQIIPIASLKDPRNQLHNYHIIPVVFITQAALQNLPDTSIEQYATLICARINQMNTSFNISSITEWQIDCDWTRNTRDKYFKLLSAIKSYTSSHNILLSATLRLYPYKYRSKMGVPPADKVLLMCYNMGNLRNPNAKNSIIDPDEMEKYLTVNQPYPLPLDAALPLFSWYVWYRDKEYKGLVYPADIEKISSLNREGNKLYFTNDTVLNGRGFLKGDWLREETTTLEELQKAKQLLNRQPQRIHRLALFHLDSLILNKYPTDVLEEILGHPR